MKRKKKGATLLTVITLTSAVLITGTGLVALTVGQYKAKQAQSNRIHNLYGADSGLDAAYDAVVADFDAAGNYAKYKVDELKKGNGDWRENADKYKALEDTESALEEKLRTDPSYMPSDLEKDRKVLEKNKLYIINAEFHRSFKLFLNSKWISSNESSEGVLSNIRTDGVVKKTIGYAKCDEDGSISYSNIKIGDDDNVPIISIDPSEITLSNNKDNIEVKDADVVNINNGPTQPVKPDNFSIQQSAKVTITSKFKTAKGQNGEIVVGENERTVDSKYNITIPNYDDIFFNSQKNTTYNFNSMGLTVFGNMLVKDMGNSNFTVDKGKVYVYGDADNIPSDVIGTAAGTNISSTNVVNKYKGGISIDGNSSIKSNIKFNDDVFTAGTFNIQKNVNVELNNNLYAANMYAGRLNGNPGDNSTLKANSMILDNDLTLKATATTIEMNNFYGINDYNGPSSSNYSSYRDYNKYNSSSSIIVNTYKGDSNPSGIKINSLAYILGVAYIDTDSKYETGESVGVKGNYRAYSGEAENDPNKYSFGQDGTLYLINGKVTNNNSVDPNVSLQEKAEHFADFWSEEKNKSDLQAGGVELPMVSNQVDLAHIHSAGAIVYMESDGKPAVNKGGLVLEDDSTIAAKRRDYAKYIYNLGNDVKSSDTSKPQEILLSQLYFNRVSKDTVINGFMDITRVSDSENGKLFYNDGNIGVFNKTKEKRIVVLGKNPTYVPSKDDIVLDGSSGEISAFVVTAGDVILDGQVHLTGNIIAQGNLIVQNTGNKTITYNEEVAAAIQRVNPDVFLNVFKTGTYNEEQNSGSTELKLDYDLNKYLKSLLWQITDKAQSKK